MFLSDEEHKLLTDAVRGALVCYQWLARAANDDGRMLWSVVNKHHFWWHLAAQAKFLNPTMVWTYMPEDGFASFRDLLLPQVCRYNILYGVSQ